MTDRETEPSFRDARQDNWPIVLGLEFAGRGSFNMLSAFGVVADYIETDPKRDWRTWLPLRDADEVTIVVRFSHATKARAIRVSRTREGFSASCRLPADAYSGLTVFGMMQLVSECLLASLEKIAVKAGIPPPPHTPESFAAELQSYCDDAGISDPVAYRRRLWEEAGTLDS